MASSINAITTGSGGVVTTADNSGNLNLQSGGTTVVAVTSAGAAVTGTLSASGGIAKASLPTGSVLQVVNATTSTNVSISTTTYTDTSLTATITPTSATSKILVLVSQIFFPATQVSGAGGNLYTNAAVQLLRDSTVLTQGGADTGGGYSFGIQTTTTLANLVLRQKYSLNWLDSPATTSATTYKTQFRVGLSGMTCAAQGGSSSYEMSTITLMEIAA